MGVLKRLEKGLGRLSKERGRDRDGTATVKEQKPYLRCKLQIIFTVLKEFKLMFKVVNLEDSDWIMVNLGLKCILDRAFDRKKKAH